MTRQGNMKILIRVLCWVLFTLSLVNKSVSGIAGATFIYVTTLAES